MAGAPGDGPKYTTEKIPRAKAPSTRPLDRDRRLRDRSKRGSALMRRRHLLQPLRRGGVLLERPADARHELRKRALRREQMAPAGVRRSVPPHDPDAVL